MTRVHAVVPKQRSAKTTMRRFLTVALMLSATGFAASASVALRYEPAEVTLTGVILRQTFPGRTGYEDISKGDEPEVYWILHLSCAVEVVGSKDADIDVTESNVREMQLVLSAEDYAKYRSLVGERVVVIGSLFHSVTAHHKTAVLLRVHAMRRAPNKSPEATPGNAPPVNPRPSFGAPQL